MKGGSDTISSGMEKEITMLQQVRHPNIVLFYGAGTTPSPEGTPFLVLELVEFGTLTEYLKNNSIIPWNIKIISFALGTASGMAYVHDHLNSMHRDLKSDNLLVGANLQIKVADFGTATLITNMVNPCPTSHPSRDGSNINKRTNGVGTMQWNAPEVLRGSQSTYTSSADVYSYGIVLWQIASQAIPWTAEINEIKSSVSNFLLGTIESGKRPPLEAAWQMPPDYCKLLEKCWATEPVERPTFQSVVKTLEALVPSLAPLQRRFNADFENQDFITRAKSEPPLPAARGEWQLNYC